MNSPITNREIKSIIILKKSLPIKKKKKTQSQMASWTNSTKKVLRRANIYTTQTLPEI